MNILVISQRVPYPPNKGEKIRTFFQINHLINQGHEIDICSPLHSSEDIASTESMKQRIKVRTHQSNLAVKWVRLLKGMFTLKPLSVCNFYSAQLQSKIDRALSHKDLDAILCTSSSMAEYVFRSKTLSRLNKTDSKPTLIMDFMDLDSDKWLQYSKSSTWPMSWIYAREGRLLGQYEKRIQNAFHHCFFISQNEVDLFHERNGTSENIHVLGNGTNTDVFSPALSPPGNPDPVFIFTGVMDYRPNIDAVMWFVKNAWPGLKREFPEARFIIAGMNPSPAIQRLSKASGIEITGFVDSMLPYYHQSDYFVAPFTIARGVQNKVLQAFACGLPVISSPMGAEGIDCVDGEHILIADSGEDYLQAVLRLEKDSDLKSSIKANALKLINDQYSWDGQLKVLDDLLQARQSTVTSSI